MVKNHLPARQETCMGSLGWDNPLEKGMATHSSILSWKIPQTEEPMGYSSWVLRVGRDWVTNTHTHFYGTGSATQSSSQPFQAFLGTLWFGMAGETFVSISTNYWPTAMCVTARAGVFHLTGHSTWQLCVWHSGKGRGQLPSASGFGAWWTGCRCWAVGAEAAPGRPPSPAARSERCSGLSPTAASSGASVSSSAPCSGPLPGWVPSGQSHLARQDTRRKVRGFPPCGMFRKCLKPTCGLTLKQKRK